MRVRIACTAIVAMTAVFFDANGGALKKHFSKSEQAERIDIEERNASSDEQNKTTINDDTAGAAEIAPAKQSSAVSERPASESTGTSVEASAEKGNIVGDPVVLIINGRKMFRRSQIIADLKLLPPYMIQGYPPDKLFELLREQKLNTWLLVEQAKKVGTDRLKEFIDRVEQFKEELLGRMLLMSELSPKTENEAVLKARYTKYLVEFKKGKEFNILHIMVNTEKEIKEVLAALAKGEKFSKLAGEKSVAPSKDKGGDEGYVPIDMMPPQIKDKLIYLKEGEYTKEYIKTDNGYHVFQVVSIRETSPQKYEEAIPMLKQVIMHEEATKLLDRLKKTVKVERFSEDGTPTAEPKPTPAT